MSRIPIPASIDEAPAASRPQLEAVKKLLGTVPNLFRMVANSPAALEGYVGLLGALGKGSLPAATHERIALAVAEANGCDYCLSAHAWLGRNVARLDDAQVVEIIQHVALNTWTNYVNSVAQTEIDFPVVAARRVA